MNSNQKPEDTEFANKINIDHYKSRVYYSQNREDLILKAFFPEIEKGVFVDVGAYDPDYDSVTKLFYETNWTGINIEPQPDRFKRFVTRRPNDINLNVGVSDKKSTMKLRSYSNQGLSTFSPTMIEKYTKAGGEEMDSFVDIEVNIRTLEDIFEEYSLPSIHFLKIDVEGLETEVIAGNNWARYRPEVVCVEHNHSKEKWRNILVRADYKLCFDDGLNSYYVDSRTKRSGMFDYVQYVVIDRGGGIRSDDFEAIAKLKINSEYVQGLVWSADKELRNKTTQIEKMLLDRTDIRKILRMLIYWILTKLKIKKAGS